MIECFVFLVVFMLGVWLAYGTGRRHGQREVAEGIVEGLGLSGAKEMRDKMISKPGVRQFYDRELLVRGDLH